MRHLRHLVPFRRRAGVLPGYGLSLGFAVAYLSLLVLLPLGALVLKASSFAFVRPHDVRLLHPTQAAAQVAHGRIESLTRIGHQVRALVRLASSEALTLELARPELEVLGVREGDTVRVDITHASVFSEDYSF